MAASLIYESYEASADGSAGELMSDAKREGRKISGLILRACLCMCVRRGPLNDKLLFVRLEQRDGTLEWLVSSSSQSSGWFALVSRELIISRLDLLLEWFLWLEFFYSLAQFRSPVRFRQRSSISSQLRQLSDRQRGLVSGGGFLV